MATSSNFSKKRNDLMVQPSCQRCWLVMPSVGTSLHASRRYPCALIEPQDKRLISFYCFGPVWALHKAESRTRLILFPDPAGKEILITIGYCPKPQTQSWADHFCIENRGCQGSLPPSSSFSLVKYICSVGKITLTPEISTPNAHFRDAINFSIGYSNVSDY